ncbi:unnamed protein product, partial [Ectocarpus sp. 12 AP-2014]
MVPVTRENSNCWRRDLNNTESVSWITEAGRDTHKGLWWLLSGTANHVAVLVWKSVVSDPRNLLLIMPPSHMTSHASPSRDACFFPPRLKRKTGYFAAQYAQNHNQAAKFTSIMPQPVVDSCVSDHVLWRHRLPRALDDTMCA